MSVKTRDLAARMLEAALAIDRDKIMADGRPLWQHDIWRTACAVVGSIRTDKSAGLGQATFYRFRPYDQEDVPGLKAAQLACKADYGKMSGTGYYEIGQRARDALPPEVAVQIMWDAWVHGDAAQAEAYTRLTDDQREAIRACVDAHEIDAALRLFQTLTGISAETASIATEITVYLQGLRRHASMGWVFDVNRANIPMQNIPRPRTPTPNPVVWTVSYKK